MDYWHKFWACPFYKWNDKTKVACEGGCRLSFPDKPTACEYMDRYCANNPGWKGCTLARSLLKYHEGKIEDEKEKNKKDA